MNFPGRPPFINLCPQAIANELMWAPRFVGKYKDKLDKQDKLLMEVTATFMLGFFLKWRGEPVYGIGLPVKDMNGLSEMENYEELKRNLNEDSECDSVLLSGRPGNAKVFKIQVVRYMETESPNTESFLEFLRTKKLNKYRPDSHLHLLIWIQSGLSFEFKRLSELLNQEKVPFGSISAIGHLGDSDSLEFCCTILYPNLQGPIKYDMRQGPPKQ